MVKYIVEVKDSDENTLDTILSALDDKIVTIEEVHMSDMTDYERERFSNEVVLQIEEDVKNNKLDRVAELITDLTENDYVVFCAGDYIRTDFELYLQD